MDSDIPEEVIGAKMQSGKIMVTVRWKERIDGIRPIDTVILNEIVKERWPRILVDFYESRIKTKRKKIFKVILIFGMVKQYSYDKC